MRFSQGKEVRMLLALILLWELVAFLFVMALAYAAREPMPHDETETSPLERRGYVK